MKANYLTVLTVAIIGILLTACGEKQEQPESLEAMLNDPAQQTEVLTAMTENHDLSKRYIDNLLENDHSTGMMVDGLVKAAADDSVLAEKVSKMITQYPDLMLLTMHHFMPVINSDEHMCDGFCDHSMEHSNIAEGMCHQMKEQGMNCCN